MTKEELVGWKDLAEEYPTIEDGYLMLCDNNGGRHFGWVRKNRKKSTTWSPRLFVVGHRDGEIQDIDTYVTHWKKATDSPDKEPVGEDYSLLQ